MAAWFCFALAVGVAGWSNRLRRQCRLAVWTLTGLVLLACWKIDLIRRGPQRRSSLAGLASRHPVLGFYFLVLAGEANLPCAFARLRGSATTRSQLQRCYLLIRNFSRHEDFSDLEQRRFVEHCFSWCHGLACS